MAKKNPVTLNDVAQHVGLAKSTVAFVMSGKAADVGLAQKTIEKEIGRASCRERV